MPLSAKLSVPCTAAASHGRQGGSTGVVRGALLPGCTPRSCLTCAWAGMPCGRHGEQQCKWGHLSGHMQHAFIMPLAQAAAPTRVPHVSGGGQLKVGCGVAVEAKDHNRNDACQFTDSVAGGCSRLSAQARFQLARAGGECTAAVSVKGPAKRGASFSLLHAPDTCSGALAM